jgi:ferredoxin--NADP+ reductase
MSRPLRVAIVGAGPAGIYAGDILAKSDTPVSLDLYDRLPTPYGLIRYGVAPDHPRIKGIVTALHKVLDKPGVRFFGNVHIGAEVLIEELKPFYDAIIISTGAEQDRNLNIPGIDLPGSFGGANFVSWFDGHPDVPRDWTLDEESVAVIGVGNVALDIARILAKTADELLPTDIPANVYEGLKSSKVREVHVFGRRGPAQAKFTPLELRELDHSPNIEVIVDPEDIEYDEGSVKEMRANKQADMVAKTVQDWAIRDVGDRPHKLYLHFLHSPVEITGQDHVTGIRTERMELDGTGNVRGTGQFHDWNVGQVYRAVGYRSEPVKGLPFNNQSNTIPNTGGRIFDEDGNRVEGIYTTGWIKRGPVGLIGHTKGDALETITNLLEDKENLNPAAQPDEAAVDAFLQSKGIDYTTWEGWNKLDAHELAIGEAEGRTRIKVVPRDEMVNISQA